MFFHGPVVIPPPTRWSRVPGSGTALCPSSTRGRSSFPAGAQLSAVSPPLLELLSSSITFEIPKGLRVFWLGSEWCTMPSSRCNKSQHSLPYLAAINTVSTSVPLGVQLSNSLCLGGHPLVFRSKAQPKAWLLQEQPFHPHLYLPPVYLPISSRQEMGIPTHFVSSVE